MRKLWLLVALLAVPTASANTADIPALTGTGTGTVTERFIAGWATVDGATQIGGTTQYLAMFGDSAARNTETDQVAQATFYYNVTNLRVGAGTANCGNLLVGETITITLRVNAANTVLTGSCIGGAAANSFTLDTDTVSIAPGDRMTYSVVLTGTILARSPRVGITLEGFKVLPVTVNVTTDPVPDMVNEMLETFNAVAPLLFFLGIVAWAEFTKSPLLYVLGVIAGGIATIAVWTEIENLRILVVSLTLVAGVRAAQTYERNRIDE